MCHFQQDHPVPKKQLQLVGVTAMFLASKYEEMYPPEISDFAYVTDRAYTTAQIRDMEMTILRVLKFQLGRPLPLQFLRRASKVYEVCSSILSLTNLRFTCISLYLLNHSWLSGNCWAAHPCKIPPGAHHGWLWDGSLPTFHGGKCCFGRYPKDLGCWRVGECSLLISGANCRAVYSTYCRY